MSSLSEDNIQHLSAMLARKASLEEVQGTLKTKNNNLVKIKLYELAINDQLGMTDVKEWVNQFLSPSVTSRKPRKERVLRVSKIGNVIVSQARLRKLGLDFNPKDSLALTKEGEALVIRLDKRHVPAVEASEPAK